MIPTPIYEILPYVYMLGGTLAIIGIDNLVAKICGLILIILGGVIYQTRRRYRHRNFRLGDIKNVEVRAKNMNGSRGTTQSQREFQKGEESEAREDYTQAFKWYRKAAEQGNASAQVNLGAMYAEGRGVPQDFREALSWYHKAAKQGDDAAAFNLGVMYVEGQGVARDLRKAMKWYRQAADRENALAQFNLGTMYEQSADALSLREAVAWYRKAALHGYAPAQVNLAVMYVDGRGVRQDFQEALRWYHAAAAKDYIPAQFNLGLTYFQGHQDLPKDLAMAYVWFSRAARQGDRDAQIMRDEIIACLKPQQKAYAQQALQDSA